MEIIHVTSTLRSDARALWTKCAPFDGIAINTLTCKRRAVKSLEYWIQKKVVVNVRQKLLYSRVSCTDKTPLNGIQRWTVVVFYRLLSPFERNRDRECRRFFFSLVHFRFSSYYPDRMHRKRKIHSPLTRLPFCKLPHGGTVLLGPHTHTHYKFQANASIVRSHNTHIAHYNGIVFNILILTPKISFRPTRSPRLRATSCSIFIVAAAIACDRHWWWWRQPI